MPVFPATDLDPIEMEVNIAISYLTEVIRILKKLSNEDLNRMYTSGTNVADLCRQEIKRRREK